MNPSTTIHYSPNGYEATYLPARNVCAVTVRGYKDPNGKVVERGGPMHPEDKALDKFNIPQWDAVPAPLFRCEDRVRETFEDALLNRHDLFGKPMFRNTPDASERQFFAAAFDSAQKIRAKMAVLGVSKLIFSLPPELFTIVDCFARDKDGVFWILSCTTQPELEPIETDRISLAAYILEAGGYIPRGTTVRCGVWQFFSTGTASFHEVTNDRARARDLVIERLTATPF